METTTNNLSPRPCPTWCTNHQTEPGEPEMHERISEGAAWRVTVGQLADEPSPSVYVDTRHDRGLTVDEAHELADALRDAAASARGGRDSRGEGLSGE